MAASHDAICDYLLAERDALIASQTSAPQNEALYVDRLIRWLCRVSTPVVDVNVLREGNTLTTTWDALADNPAIKSATSNPADPKLKLAVIASAVTSIINTQIVVRGDLVQHRWIDASIMNAHSGAFAPPGPVNMRLTTLAVQLQNQQNAYTEGRNFILYGRRTPPT